MSSQATEITPNSARWNQIRKAYLEKNAEGRPRYTWGELAKALKCSKVTIGSVCADLTGKREHSVPRRKEKAKRVAAKRSSQQNVKTETELMNRALVRVRTDAEASLKERIESFWTELRLAEPSVISLTVGSPPESGKAAPRISLLIAEERVLS